VNTMSKVIINTRVEKPIYDLLLELTKILGVTKSEIVRQALIFYFKELKSASIISSLKEYAEKENSGK